LIPLSAFVGSTLVGGSWAISRKLRHDPTIVTHHQSDPFPYLKVGPNENLKLYAVNQKFEDNEKEHIDLMDILSDRYDI
jgi:hypothetical protein